jgi:hypothetical protein
MFGGNRNNSNRESLSTVMTPDNPPVKKSGGGSSVTGFDPEGLERAAKAARELDASRNASQAIELIKTQEATKQVCVNGNMVENACEETSSPWIWGLGRNQNVGLPDSLVSSDDSLAPVFRCLQVSLSGLSSSSKYLSCC